MCCECGPSVASYDAEDMNHSTVPVANFASSPLSIGKCGNDLGLMFGVVQSVGDEFRHVDGTAAAGAFGARVVWSVSERLV